MEKKHSEDKLLGMILMSRNVKNKTDGTQAARLKMRGCSACTEGSMSQHLALTQKGNFRSSSCRLEQLVSSPTEQISSLFFVQLCHALK